MESGTKMLRKVARTLAQASSVAPEEVEVKHVRNLIGGINTSVAAEDLADNEFQVLNNVDIRKSRIVRRLGHSLYTTAPNANKVLGLFAVKRYNSTTDILRFTRNSIHKLQSGAWVAITGVALTGSDYDPWTVVVVEDRIFASNGIQNLFELNLTANTYAAAGNARTYKYYVVANRRICAANLVSGTSVPIEFATCGNRNYTEWNPLTDISAYQNPMVDAESYTSDEITGLLAFKDNVVVLRENSVWVGYPQPVASTPFDFRKVISGVGCTCPSSVQKVGDDKAIWYDMATSKVYLFKLNVNGVELVDISSKVSYSIDTDIQDFRYVSSAYNSDEDEYELVINPPGALGTAKVWKYCLLFNAWVNHTSNNTSRIWYLKLPIVSGSIESLGSVPISSLSGTISGLSSTVNSKISKFISTIDGNIGIETPGEYRDIGYFSAPRIVSKAYELETARQNILSLELDIKIPGWMFLKVMMFTDYYANAIRTWLKYTSGNLIKVYKHNALCDQFWWEVTLESNYQETFFLDGYTLRRTKSGDF